MSDALFRATVRLAHTNPKLRDHLLPLLKSAKEEEKESRFEKGKPADPTKNMSPEDKAEWNKQKEMNKDKFKGASLRAATIRLAHENPELRAHLLPLLKEAGCEKLPAGPMRDNCEKGGPKGKGKDDKKDDKSEGKGDKKDDKKDDKLPDFLKNKKKSDFDPEEISETKPGPEQSDADEASYMKDNFTQEESSELQNKQQSGGLGKAAALRKATIRLAHTKPHLRKHLLPLLQD